MKKRGITRIIIGIILIALQALSAIGNALAGVDLQLSFQTLAVFIYDLVYLTSYFFIGIIGLILLISGIVAYSKCRIDKHAAAKSAPAVSEFCDTESQSSADSTISTTPTLTEAAKQSTKRRFCKLCGGLIDSHSKKCTQCDKQYFDFHIAKKPIFITLSIIVVLGITAFGIYHFIGQQSKGADYLYNWMTANGTLVDGTYLQYSGIDEDGTNFTLCYDTSYVDNYRWYVRYTATDDKGRTIETRLTLFCEGSDTPTRITVNGSGDFDGYYRYMEFSHNPQKFTDNSPIEMGTCDGSTVVRDIFIAGQGPTTVVDDKEGLQDELNTMDRNCQELAHENLCLILDWLKDSFCPAAEMTMSDFGYKNYS